MQQTQRALRRPVSAAGLPRRCVALRAAAGADSACPVRRAAAAAASIADAKRTQDRDRAAALADAWAALREKVDALAGAELARLRELERLHRDIAIPAPATVPAQAQAQAPAAPGADLDEQQQQS